MEVIIHMCLLMTCIQKLLRYQWQDSHRLNLATTEVLSLKD